MQAAPGRRSATALLLAAAAAAVVAAVALRPRRVVVTGDSMAPALHPGDRLILVRGRPRRGDVVALRHPDRPALHAVKRVAALPGESVVTARGRLSAGTGYIVLGDNRAASTDSRDFGAVRRALVLGRAVYRYAPEHRRGRLPAAGSIAQ